MTRRKETPQTQTKNAHTPQPTISPSGERAEKGQKEKVRERDGEGRRVGGAHVRK